MDMSIGRFKGIEKSHTAQKSAETKGMPKSYEDAFASSKVQDMQASFKAFMKETDKENPLAKRTITPFEKGKYPHGGKSAGRLPTEVPLNRMS
ncbi:MAG: hypothetical protein K1060chlam4_00924 [Candidatus Anoxychlamydiales bacterium]|nr:hypothetical protein [Candidatus Anoxychlamydiales bacterium]